MNDGVSERLAKISNSAVYWAGLVVIGLCFEGVALYYQYVLELQPCVLCIQVRIWVMALILVSLLAIWIRRNAYLNLLAHMLTVVIAIGLLERSYQLLGTERGFTYSDCGLDLGMPAWFALDSWFPAMFKVQTSCGYTPELLFGVTMAEALMVSSVILLLVSAGMVVSVLLGFQSGKATDSLS
ncbi:MAG: disulfide bond formation protein B [Gammaproteobacteria bacterium]